jgi:hypothetical protein
MARGWVGVDSLSLVLFDFQTQKWSQLAKVRATFMNWSRDGQYVYFLRCLDNPAVMRIRIADHKMEQVSDLTSLSTTGNIGPWLGLDPDDSPLVLRDVGTQDIFLSRLGRALKDMPREPHHRCLGMAQGFIAMSRKACWRKPQ